MLTFETWVGLTSWKSIRPMGFPALLILSVISLASCTGEGAGGPIVSSLSSPTDGTAELDSNQDTHSELTHHDGGDEDPIITMISTPTGVTAHVAWNPPPDINVVGYSIYYGKRVSEESRSQESHSEEATSDDPNQEEASPAEPCSQGESQAVESPPATITGLEPNTRYFLAIRAFNQSESICSNEITIVTPPAQS